MHPNTSNKWVATRRSALPFLAIVAVTLISASYSQLAYADEPIRHSNAPAAAVPTAMAPVGQPGQPPVEVAAPPAQPQGSTTPGVPAAPASTAIQAAPGAVPPAQQAPAVTPSSPVVLPNTSTPSPAAQPGAAAPAPAVLPITAAPAPAVLPITAFTPKDYRAASQITVRMMRIASAPIGTSDSVSMWVFGDGSGASLRLRLLNVVAGPWATRDVTLQPSWISAPRLINFTGWKQLVFPKASFALKVPSEAALSIDPILPADAQRPDSVPSVDRTWADVNALVIETTVLTQSRIGLDDVAWATSDGKGGVKVDNVIDDFETGNVAAWKAVGSRDEQGSVSYGLKSQPGSAHSGKIALYYTAITPAKRRSVVLMPLAQRIMQVTGNPYLVFTPSSLFQPILPSTLPEAASIGSTMDLRVCAGQIAATSFCVYSKAALSNVKVTADTDLSSTGQVIPKTALDIDVVQVRKQL